MPRGPSSLPASTVMRPVRVPNTESLSRMIATSRIPESGGNTRSTSRRLKTSRSYTRGSCGSSGKSTPQHHVPEGAVERPHHAAGSSVVGIQGPSPGPVHEHHLEGRAVGTAGEAALDPFHLRYSVVLGIGKEVHQVL